MTNTRKQQRAPVSLIARYRSPTVFEFVEEECVDLSSGGMFIKSSAPAPPGTLLKIEFHADEDGDRGSVKAVARVIWCREAGEESGETGMGIKFVRLDPESREFLENFVARLSIPSSPESEASPDRPSDRASQPAARAATAAATEPSGADVAKRSAPPSADEPAPGAQEAAEQSSAAATQPAEDQPERDRDEPEHAATEAEATPRGARETGAQPPGRKPVQPRPNAGSSRAMWVGALAAAVVVGVLVVVGVRGGDDQEGPPQTTAQSAEEGQEPERPSPPPNAPSAQKQAVPEQPEPAEPEPTEPEPAEPEPAEPEPTPPSAAADAQQPENADQAAAGPQQTGEPAAEPAETAEPNPAAHPIEQYIVTVITTPPGATVGAEGALSFKAPGRMRFDEPPEGVRVTAQLEGYEPTAGRLDAADFERVGSTMRKRLYLRLKPAEEPAPERRGPRSRTDQPDTEQEPPASPDDAPEDPPPTD